MANSHARLVYGELLTVLRADLGDYDLSTVTSMPRVVVGISDTPPASAPFLYLGAPTLIDDIYGEAAIGEYDETIEIPIVGVCSSTSLSIETRVLDGLDFAEEVRRAITDAHAVAANTTLYSLLRLLVRIDEVAGDLTDMPVEFVVFRGRIQYRRITSGGI